MCHFRKVQLFLNGIKGCFFCWVQHLLGVSDGAIFLEASMFIGNIPKGCQTVIIYCFYSSLN